MLTGAEKPPAPNFLMLSVITIFSPEVQLGMYQKEEKMGRHQRLLKQYSCQLQPLTYLSCNRASLKEVCPWMTSWLFQVNKFSINAEFIIYKNPSLPK